MSIIIAFKLFFKALFNKEFATRAVALFNTSEVSAAPQAENGLEMGATALLALLQREGRLLDFFKEDIQNAPDAQIGAVVKSTVYSGCRQALQDYLTISPVMDSTEGESITVEEGFDPTSIRLVGKVEGDPPFQGILRHRGWKLETAKLPQCDSGIICPAEVEIA